MKKNRLKRKAQPDKFSLIPSKLSLAPLKEIQSEKEKFQKYLQLSNAIVVALDRQGRVTLINKKGCAILGRKEKEILGKNWFRNFIPAMVRGDVEKTFRKLVLWGIVGAEYFENSILTFHGKERLIRWHNAILRNKKGKIEGTLSSGEDITEQRSREVELGQLAAVVKRSTELINLATLDGQMIFLNEAGSRMLGIPPSDVRKVNIMQVIPKQYKKMVQRELLPTLQKRGQWSGELQYLNLKTGKLTDVRAVSFTINDSETRRPLYLANISMDITGQKRAEAMLQESEKRLRQIFNNTQDGLLIADISSRKFIECNKSIAKMLGYSEAQIQSLSIKDVHPAKELARVSKTFDHLLKGTLSMATNVPMKRKNGTVFYVDITASPVHFSGRRCLAGFFRDVTERRKAEEELKDSEAKFKVLFNDSREGILVADSNTKKFAMCNTTMCRMLGYTKEELMKLGVKDIHPQKDLPYIIKEAFEKQMRGEVKIAENLPVKRKNGSVFYADINASPILLGQKKYLLGSFRDVTERRNVQQALRQSEQRFRRIFESSRDAMMTLEPPSWRFTSGNPSMVRMFRARNEAEFTSYEPWVLSPKRQSDGTDSREKAIKMIKIAMREGSHFFEWTHKRIDGELFPAEVLLTRVLGETKMFLQATVRDITDRKRSEEAIRLSEERLGLQFSRMPVGCIVWDPSFKVLSWNPAAARIFGYSAKEAMGKHPYDLIVPKQSQSQVDEIWSRLLKGDETANSINENSTKTNGTILCKWTNTPLRRADGGILGVLSMVEDITELKKAEESLQKSAKEWQSTFDAVNDAVWLLSPDRRILRCNKATEDFLMKKASDIIGRTCCELVHGTKKPPLECPMHRVLKSRRRESCELFLFNRWFLITVDPILDKKGALTGAVHIASDITGRKRVEEFRNEIVRTVSHELRTPLSIEKEGISLLLDGSAGTINPEQETILQTVRKNIDRLARMIDNLLDISRIEAGKLQLKKEVVDLNALIRDVVFEFRNKTTKKNLELKINLPKGEIRVHADADKVMQVFNNLLDNALKFTVKGGIEIGVSVLETEVECYVQDTGIGISAGNIATIFEKFQQHAREAGPGEKGLGLGLSIVHGIIEMHRGRIWAKSRLGKGTRITFTLPLYRKEAR